MNKLLFTGIVCIAELSLFAGQEPKSPVQINILNSSGNNLRRSSDTIAIIPATTKVLNAQIQSSSSSSHSSGSSPVGCYHLFPGEQGNGINSTMRLDMLPIAEVEFASRRQ